MDWQDKPSVLALGRDAVRKGRFDIARYAARYLIDQGTPWKALAHIPPRNTDQGPPSGVFGISSDLHADTAVATTSLAAALDRLHNGLSLSLVEPFFCPSAWDISTRHAANLSAEICLHVLLPLLHEHETLDLQDFFSGLRNTGLVPIHPILPREAGHGGTAALQAASLLCTVAYLAQRRYSVFEPAYCSARTLLVSNLVEPLVVETLSRFLVRRTADFILGDEEGVVELAGMSRAFCTKPQTRESI